MAADFMGLPCEVRVMIYELCLPIGKELILKPTACDKEDIAAGHLQAASFPALLRANSAIRTEATAVFYGKNTWRIMDVPQGLRLPSLFKEHVRKATVTFDRRIFKIDDFWEISDVVFESGIKARWRLGETHDDLKDHLFQTWVDKCKSLGKLSLTELTVDFARCRCPLGCCRMVEEVLDWLTIYATLEGDGKITATGFFFHREREMIHEADMRCEECFKGPEEQALAAGYCSRSLLDEEY